MRGARSQAWSEYGLHPRSRYNGPILRRLFATLFARGIVAGVGAAAFIVAVAAAQRAEAAGPGGKKVLRLDAVKVEGRIQKPQAFFILQRSAVTFEGMELRQSFLPKIIKSVEDKPFQ